jgi:hypothetical protein
VIGVVDTTGGLLERAALLDRAAAFAAGGPIRAF